MEQMLPKSIKYQTKASQLLKFEDVPKKYVAVYEGPLVELLQRQADCFLNLQFSSS